MRSQRENTTSPTVHVFERAGLGKAPFRVVGLDRRVGPMEVPGQPGMTVGAPGQPMGSCDYCGTGIADCFTIRSADGRTFVVGSDCVYKTGDAGLRKQVEPMVRQLRQAQRDDLYMRRRAWLTDTLADPAVQDILRAEPHPLEWRQQLGDTRLEWADWMLRHSGNQGLRAVQKYLATKTGRTMDRKGRTR